jgi:hypothetical protein
MVMKPCNCIQHCNCSSLADPRRRSFLAEAVAGLAAAAVFPTTPAKAALDVDRRKFMEEATRLATESVQKGWGGPFGAVIAKDGEIIGSQRGADGRLQFIEGFYNPSRRHSALGYLWPIEYERKHDGLSKLA